jgi:signal transduction histidine kinase/CheY-like chemotaxis protein
MVPESAALHAVLDTMDIGVCLLDDGGHIVHANGPFVRATGLEADPQLPLWERIDAPLLRAELERAAQGEVVDVVLSGRERGRPWLARAKKAPGAGILLTERPRPPLPSELQLLATTPEPLPIGLSLLEARPDGVFVIAYNDRYVQLVGAAPTPEARVGQLPFRVFRPDRLTAYPQSELPGPLAARTGQRVRDQELHVLRSDGRWRVLSVSATPLGQQSNRAMAVLLDITERYEAEQESLRGYTLYRAVVTHIGDLLVLLSPRREGARIVDWVVRDANDTLLTALGRTREQMVGHPASEILPENTRRIHERWERVLATGEPWSYELEHGSSSYLVRAFRVDDDTLGSASIDITERRRAEARVEAERERLRQAEDAMRRSRAELQELIEQVSFGVFVMRDERIVYANPTFAAYVGAAGGGELVGMALEQLLVPTRDSRRWRVRRQTGRPTTLEIGQTRPIELDGHPSTLWTALDLTELVETQARLVQSDRLAAVGTLAAAVAHEINNPLTFVASALDFLHEQLAQQDTSGELCQALVEAREGASRVRHVVKDLERVSRGGGDRPGPVSAIELREVLASAVHLANNEIRHRASLSLELGELPPVLAEQSAVGQLFLNLLLNAAQAIEPGAARAEIRVVARTDARGWAHIEVHDTGAGIPEEHLGSIFDAFFTTKPVGSGTGLGLWICRRTVERYAGEIEVQSQVGVGTVVRIGLPPAPEGAAPIRPSEPRPPAPSRGRVLVVDDEPSIGSALKRMLGRRHEVTCLTSPRAARELLASGARFEAILCDVMMRELNGVELWHEIDRLSKEQAARVVFISGGAFTPETERFLRTTRNPSLGKPFDLGAVHAAVDRLVGAAWGTLAGEE